METKTYLDRFLDFAWNYGPQVLMAIALLIVGMWVIKRFTRGLDAFLRTRKVDDSLRPFFLSLTEVGLKVVLLLVVASMVGLETTSFIAIFSALAFSVGLALQGSLGNFASGVLILLFKPYRVGDLIKVVGLAGTVKEIQIFNTILLTPQGKRIIIPNGKMTDGPIENIAEGAEVQAEVTVLVDSETSLDALRRVAEEVVARCRHRLPDRPAAVQLAGITRDDLKAQIGCWTTGRHYEETLHFMFEALNQAFADAGIKLAKERRRENLM